MGGGDSAVRAYWSFGWLWVEKPKGEGKCAYLPCRTLSPFYHRNTALRGGIWDTPVVHRPRSPPPGTRCSPATPGNIFERYLSLMFTIAFPPSTPTVPRFAYIAQKRCCPAQKCGVTPFLALVLPSLPPFRCCRWILSERTSPQCLLCLPSAA